MRAPMQVLVSTTMASHASFSSCCCSDSGQLPPTRAHRGRCGVGAESERRKERAAAAAGGGYIPGSYGSWCNTASSIKQQNGHDSGWCDGRVRTARRTSWAWGLKGSGWRASGLHIFSWQHGATGGSYCRHGIVRKSSKWGAVRGTAPGASRWNSGAVRGTTPGTSWMQN